MQNVWFWHQGKKLMWLFLATVINVFFKHRTQSFNMQTSYQETDYHKHIFPFSYVDRFDVFVSWYHAKQLSQLFSCYVDLIWINVPRFQTGNTLFPAKSWMQ